MGDDTLECTDINRNLRHPDAHAFQIRRLKLRRVSGRVDAEAGIAVAEYLDVEVLAQALGDLFAALAIEEMPRNARCPKTGTAG
ncbi:hypothetical protein V6766_14545 [Martelella sp. AMO21009]